MQLANRGLDSMACRTPWHFRAAGMSGLFSASPVNVQEAHGYMRAIQQCSTDLYRTAVTSSYCVSYRRLAINWIIIIIIITRITTSSGNGHSRVNVENLCCHFKHWVTLAGHSLACKLQAGHADSPVTAQRGAVWPTYQTYCCILVAQVATRRHLRSAARHLLTVRHYRRRAFDVAGPTAFNVLPNDLRDPTVSTPTFGQSLKMRLFSAYPHV